MPDNHSVTLWIAQLKERRPEAFDALFRRYYDQLVSFAGAIYRQRFCNVARPVEDEEGAALSAVGSFCERVAGQGFHKLEDREDLWAILVQITIGKIYDQRERALAAKRGGLNPTTGLIDAESQGPADPLPGPDAVADMRETYCLAMHALTDPVLQRIARLDLDGWTHAEIAADLHVTERTVYRKLQRSHEIWNETFTERLAPSTP